MTDFESIENYLEKERYVIQTWVESSDELPRQLLERGYELIMSTKNAWYFDHGFWGRTPYYQWNKVYENRLPLDSGVLGGEACVWTELIDEQNLGKSITRDFCMTNDFIVEFGFRLENVAQGCGSGRATVDQSGKPRPNGDHPIPRPERPAEETWHPLRAHRSEVLHPERRRVHLISCSTSI